MVCPLCGSPEFIDGELMGGGGDGYVNTHIECANCHVVLPFTKKLLKNQAISVKI
jgi:hypothetical protein